MAGRGPPGVTAPRRPRGFRSAAATRRRGPAGPVYGRPRPALTPLGPPGRVGATSDPPPGVRDRPVDQETRRDAMARARRPRDRQDDPAGDRATGAEPRADRLRELRLRGRAGSGRLGVD